MTTSLLKTLKESNTGTIAPLYKNVKEELKDQLPTDHKGIITSELFNEIVQYAVKNNLYLYDNEDYGRNDGEPMHINGLQFYPRFVYSSSKNYKTRSLQDVYGEDLYTKFVIAAHTTKYKKDDGKPVSKFAVFNDGAVGYLKWMDKINVEHRNCFEYIINPMRKLILDIDVSMLKEDEYAKYNTTKDSYITNYYGEDKMMGLMVELIDRFQQIIGPIDIEKDVMLCSSSGPSGGAYKYSYHLIFTKYMFHCKGKSVV